MKNIYSIMLFGILMAMSSCQIGDVVAKLTRGNDTPPKDALPSADFKLNNLADEPFAADAILINAKDSDAPFQSLELFPDGHYLMVTANTFYANVPTMGIGKKTDGCFSFNAKNVKKVEATRSGEDGDETLTMPGGEYGSFEKIGDKEYRLSNGDEIDLKEATGSDSKITYRGHGGRISNVYVNVNTPSDGAADTSICRTWNMDSFELFMYWCGHYVVHAKQAMVDGQVKTSFDVNMDIYDDEDQEDVVGDDGEYCYKVIFSKNGTYMCFYMNGEVGISTWTWQDKSQGTLYYNWNEGGADDGYVTVRFAGKQMRIYEDYTYNEEFDDDDDYYFEDSDDFYSGYADIRMVIVNTLTAAN